MNESHSSTPSLGVAPSSVLFEQVKMARDQYVNTLIEDTKVAVATSQLDLTELIDSSISFNTSADEGS